MDEFSSMNDLVSPQPLKPKTWGQQTPHFLFPFNIAFSSL